MKKWMLMALMMGMALTGCARTSSGCCGAGTCASCQAPANDDDAQQWQVLFDGTSTQHWRGFKRDSFPEQGWEIADGTLHKIAGVSGGDIITVQQYDSFEFAWQWKVAQGANSGVMFHVAEADDLGATFFTGPEYQILEDTHHRDGDNPKTSTASLYALIACNDQKTLAPVGEWNSSRILVDGNHVEHWLNGAKVVEYELGSGELNAMIADSKFKQWPRFAQEGRGHIALQDHGDDVWFRNMRIREIQE